MNLTDTPCNDFKQARPNTPEGSVYSRMLNIIIIISLTIGGSSCLTSIVDDGIMHPYQLHNIQITSIAPYNSTYERVFYWDMRDTTRRKCLIHEIFKPLFKVHKESDIGWEKAVSEWENMEKPRKESPEL